MPEGCFGITRVLIQVSAYYSDQRWQYWYRAPRKGEFLRLSPFNQPAARKRNRYADFLKEASDIGVRVHERPLTNGLCGFYFDPARAIVIDEELCDFQKRCVLCHELCHARHRDTGKAHMTLKEETRARKETALRLIDPESYETAELTYEGDLFQMANELNVTIQVIQDYRDLLEARNDTTNFYLYQHREQESSCIP